MRQIFFWMHLCFGVTAGVVIFVMAVTGVMLSFEPQLVDLAEKSKQYVSIADATAPRLTGDEILSKVKDALPNKTPSGLTVQNEAGRSVWVPFGRDGGTYVHPVTGEMLGGHSTLHKAFHVVEDVHRWLANRKFGRPVTGAANLFFVVLVLSGLYLWWPKSVLFFKTGLRGYARDWNWHNVFGFWASWLLLFTTLTGVVMSYAWASNLLYRVTGSEPPKTPPAQMGLPQPASISPANVEGLLTAARAQSPTWQSVSLRFPQKEDAPVTAMIQEPAVWWNPSPRSTLSLNPETSEIVKWEPFSQLNSARKARIMVRYVHTGEILGWFGQFVAALAAISALFLVWTGLSLALRRYRRRSPSSTRSIFSSRPRPEEDAVLIGDRR